MLYSFIKCGSAACMVYRYLSEYEEYRDSREMFILQLRITAKKD